MLCAKRVPSNVRPMSFREEPSKGTGEDAAGYGVKHLRMDCRDNVGNGLSAAGTHSNLQRLEYVACKREFQRTKVGRMSLI
jgi:hypothetical protein